MRTQTQTEFLWSAEDQEVYVKWRRGVLAFYGLLGLVMGAAIMANHFAGTLDQLAGM